MNGEGQPCITVDATKIAAGCIIGGLIGFFFNPGESGTEPIKSVASIERCASAIESREHPYNRFGKFSFKGCEGFSFYNALPSAGEFRQHELTKRNVTNTVNNDSFHLTRVLNTLSGVAGVGGMAFVLEVLRKDNERLIF